MFKNALMLFCDIAHQPLEYNRATHGRDHRKASGLF
jgi:hypothetical protein